MKKIPIWGENIPYNQPTICKADIMKIRKIPKGMAAIRWAGAVFGSRICKDTSAFDTFTWYDEIKTGKVSAYLNDIPALTWYPSDASCLAVIVIPGGGFCNQSRNDEGENIARFLNSCGISAFVLEYRMNPYKGPVFYLDLQRAIRYIRYHAKEYGIAPDQISTIGFSAGGYIAGAAAMLLKNEAPNTPGYIPDDVDGVDGRANSIALIYPVSHFEDNPSMLSLVAGDDFFDHDKREELIKEYSLINRAGTCAIPQFLCYGSKDLLKGNERYAAVLNDLGNPHKTIEIKGANHGFALNQKKYAWWADEYIKWLIGLTKKKGI